MIYFLGRIISAPFRALAWIYRRWGPVGIVGLIVIIALILVMFRVNSCNVQKMKELSAPPTVQEAPWLAQTESRMYYVGKYHQLKDKTYVLDVYWGQQGLQWIRYDKPLTLGKAFGIYITVTKR